MEFRNIVISNAAKLSIQNDQEWFCTYDDRDRTAIQCN